MKKNYLLFALLILSVTVSAQTALYNNGATITVKPGAMLFVNGNLTNVSGSTIDNAGGLRTTGAVMNNATITSPSGSTLFLQGSSAQTLGGTTPISVTDVEVSNPAGVTLNTPMRVSGTLKFNSGIINATNTNFPLILTTSGTISSVNAPSNTSHVNGYVIKEGTGSFTYPVGNGTRYQPVTVNLTANSAGLRARHFSGDAGTGNFTTGGSDAVPLTNYNKNEYWDLSPLGTATGTVAISWDGYNDAFPYALAQRRVAHKVGLNWVNEGGLNPTGTISNGSIASNSITNWSPFTLGSIGFPMPVNWISFTGERNQNAAVLRWKVAETDVASYEVQKSGDAVRYTTLTQISSAGNGTNSYTYTDQDAGEQNTYYRIRQRDRNGEVSYSSIVLLNTSGADVFLRVYPNPTADNVMLTTNSEMKAVRVYNEQGREVKAVVPNAKQYLLRLFGLPAGMYEVEVETKNGKDVRRIIRL